MKTLRCLLVDDEPPARHALSVLLGELPDVEIAGVAADGLEALDVLARQPIDLLFLDIEMPVLAGIELATRLQPAVRPVVVFVTAWPHYAVKSYELEAADYLLKPVDPERLKSAVRRARRQLELDDPARTGSLQTAARLSRGAARSRIEHIWADTTKAKVKLALEDIERFCAYGDYVQVHTAERSFLMHDSLSRLSAELPPGFLRVHRSAIVNLSAVVRVAVAPNGQLRLTLASGAQVAVGRRLRGHVRRRLGT